MNVKSRNVNIHINAMILLTVTQPLTFYFFSNCDELDFKVSDKGPAYIFSTGAMDTLAPKIVKVRLFSSRNFWTFCYCQPGLKS